MSSVASTLLWHETTDNALKRSSGSMSSCTGLLKGRDSCIEHCSATVLRPHEEVLFINPFNEFDLSRFPPSVKLLPHNPPTVFLPLWSLYPNVSKYSLRYQEATEINLKASTLTAKTNSAGIPIPYQDKRGCYYQRLLLLVLAYSALFLVYGLENRWIIIWFPLSSIDISSRQSRGSIKAAILCVRRGRGGSFPGIKASRAWTSSPSSTQWRNQECAYLFFCFSICSHGLNWANFTFYFYLTSYEQNNRLRIVNWRSASL